MKHQSARRRNGRRHADPSVICLPSQLPPYTPPRKEPEVTGSASSSVLVRDDDELDAELLAHKNIFDAPPRISRQARRKAIRAERKAARRTATERFLSGAPSLGEAAQIFSVAAMPAEIAAATLSIGPQEEIVEPGDTLVAERVEIVALEEIDSEPIEAEHMDQGDDEAVPLETIAQMISATGPLIVPSLETALEEAAQEAETHPELAPLPMPKHIEEAIAAELKALEPLTLEAGTIEQLATPLPRNRALVPARRSWMMRLIPWQRSRNVPATEPALAQLQALRFELAMTLRRLDQIIDTLPENIVAGR
jgi:hypothetical protein